MAFPLFRALALTLGFNFSAAQPVLGRFHAVREQFSAELHRGLPRHLLAQTGEAAVVQVGRKEPAWRFPAGTKGPSHKLSSVMYVPGNSGSLHFYRGVEHFSSEDPRQIIIRKQLLRIWSLSLKNIRVGLYKTRKAAHLQRTNGHDRTHNTSTHDANHATSTGFPVPSTRFPAAAVASWSRSRRPVPGSIWVTRPTEPPMSAAHRDRSATRE